MALQTKYSEKNQSYFENFWINIQFSAMSIAIGVNKTAHALLDIKFVVKETKT